MILRVQGGRDHRCRRICAHPAGVGPRIAFLEALVILAGSKRQHVVAVGHDDKADLLAFDKLLDHNPGVGSCFPGPHLPPALRPTAACASSSVVATTTPFPAASPSALITMGAPFSST